MSNEILLYRSRPKEGGGILNFRDIEIIPFEGQGTEQSTSQKSEAVKPIEKVDPEPKELQMDKEPPKKFTIDSNSGLNTLNIGIKDILEGGKEKKEEELNRQSRSEKFSEDDLKLAWHAYALKVKREGRNRIHATLTTSDWTLTSELKIILKIGQAQLHDVENEKGPLLEFLRDEVKNDQLSFEHDLIEIENIKFSSSKDTFEKLAEENKSLDKFRKLFNLDIEY